MSDTLIKDIKVSVIVPTFNDEKFIKETLESILNQTHTNFEVLLIDDCSSDSTLKIVQSFKDERIKIFINPNNLGAAYSRNRGISLATGDFIAFLDGDDLWLNDKLETQLIFMINNDVDFSYTYYCCINSLGESLGVYYSGPKKISHKKFLRACYVGCLTVMYRRDIYPDLSIPASIRKRNDYALWLKLSERTDCHLLPEIKACYRKRDNGSLSSGSKTSLLRYHKMMFKDLYNVSSFTAFIFAIRNVFYYFYKQIRYKRKH